MWQQKLKDLRSAGLTWQEIGTYCGVGRSTIHDISKGRTKEPSKPVAAKLKRLHTIRMRQKDNGHVD